MKNYRKVKGLIQKLERKQKEYVMLRNKAKKMDEEIKKIEQEIENELKNNDTKT